MTAFFLYKEQALGLWQEKLMNSPPNVVKCSLRFWVLP